MPAHSRNYTVTGVLLWCCTYLWSNSAEDVIESVPGVSPRLQSKIPEISACRQPIMVTTASWDDVSATVRFYKRVCGNTSWRMVGTAFPAVIGQRGLGWGIGLHGTGERGAPRRLASSDYPRFVVSLGLRKSYFPGYDTGRLRLAGKAVFTEEGKRRLEHALADSAGDVFGLTVGQG